jgi:sulfate permease, SulP family
MSLFAPKILLCLKEGYTKKIFRDDVFAGIGVGVIALPLALAFAIGSGVAPERGLFTAIIAGFLISLLGGSRVQIGGPTGAFVVIIYTIVQEFGYDGLAVATLLAGVMMLIMGITRLGVLLKFVPYPVTTGFTTGIAVVIFSSQINDFLGLNIANVPPHFVEQWAVYWNGMAEISTWAFTTAFGSLVSIFVIRRLFPNLPAVIIVLAVATVVSYLLGLPIETIQSKFGAIPRVLPIPSLPYVSFELVQKVFPSAITIALLGSIESLLSAAVADGMTGHRHRSNAELIAQGIANIGSIIFGGIPATGAIARTSANIKMGAKTPIAGIVHAVTLLLLMLVLAPLAGQIPLSVLAAVLVYVAWNMSELGHFIEILRFSVTDAVLLCVTFFLTVFIDLTVAVQVGVVLSAFIFLKNMTSITKVEACQVLVNEDLTDHPEFRDAEVLFRKDVPKDVTIFEIIGPFFYSIANLLDDSLNQLRTTPRVYVLRMRKVPIVDATGMRALKNFQAKCKKRGIVLLISGASDKMISRFRKSGLLSLVGEDHIFPDIEAALAYIRGSGLTFGH